MGQRGEPDEFIHYRDEGCSIAPRCLACPLEACRFDLPPKRAGAMMREMEVARLFAQGMAADEAAAAMGVSRRTVFRLKAALLRGSTPLPVQQHHHEETER